MNRRECLDVAASCVLSDRNNEYGGPEDSFMIIADLWAVILQRSVSMAEVALCMDAVKTARLIKNPSHVDSWVDKAGYAACGAEVATSTPTDKATIFKAMADGVTRNLRGVGIYTKESGPG